MNVTTIQMPVAEAEKKVREYRTAIDGGTGQPGDRLILKAFRAIAKGLRIIDAKQAIIESGTNDRGWPKLAIVRANAKFCWYQRWTSRAVFSSQQSTQWHHRRNLFELPSDAMPPIKEYHLRALTPTIPPNLRPAGDLEAYHILFEAEWRPIAPKDPLLLKHLGGPLYVVLAGWDLTEVERAVLGMRFQAS